MTHGGDGADDENESHTYRGASRQAPMGEKGHGELTSRERMTTHAQTTGAGAAGRWGAVRRERRFSSSVQRRARTRHRDDPEQVYMPSRHQAHKRNIANPSTYYQIGLRTRRTKPRAPACVVRMRPSREPLVEHLSGVLDPAAVDKR